MPRSTIMAAPSSSRYVPWSIERTPARTARLMPSAPWACDITQVPRSAAVRTIAPTSSWEKFGSFGSSVGEKNPPDDAILTTSAPARITSRTFRVTPSMPSQTPDGIPGYTTPHGLAPPLGSHGSLCPPVIDSIVRLTCMRGPANVPSSTAIRSPASAPEASRTVVIPSARVLRRFSATR